MKITVTSVMVDDQDKALAFYTKIFGLVKKQLPLDESKWLPFMYAEPGQELELLLEPLIFSPAMIYQKASFKAGIPCSSFGVCDIQVDYEKPETPGLTFKMKPTPMGSGSMTMLSDTCGNFIQLGQL